MTNGMRFDNDDIRALPLHMQEQVGVEIAARMAEGNAREALGVVSPSQTHLVAGHRIKPPLLVVVKRLCFTNTNGLERYQMLRDAVREGVISNLMPIQYDGRIVAFTYNIQWNRETLPHTVPVRTLLWWSERVREYGVGVMVHERIKRRCKDEKKIPET